MSDALYKHLRSSLSSSTRSASRLKSIFTPLPQLLESPHLETSAVIVEQSFRAVVKSIQDSNRRNERIGLDKLFILKSAHCRLVAQLKHELKVLQLKRKCVEVTDPNAPGIRHFVEMRIVDSYAMFQSCLESGIVEDSLSADLTHQVMSAKAFWDMARIVSIDTLRSHCYALARQRYAQVLTLAENHLNADDLSMLRLLYKITNLLIESLAHLAPTHRLMLVPRGGEKRKAERFVSDDICALVERCRRATANAEEKMASTMVDLSKERKMIRIKGSLMRLSLVH